MSLIHCVFSNHVVSTAWLVQNTLEVLVSRGQLNLHNAMLLYTAEECGRGGGGGGGGGCR